MNNTGEIRSSPHRFFYTHRKRTDMQLPEQGLRVAINKIKARRKSDAELEAFNVELRKLQLSRCEYDHLSDCARPLSERWEDLEALRERIEHEARCWTRYTDRFDPSKNGVYISWSATDCRVQAVERDLNFTADKQTVAELLCVFEKAFRRRKESEGKDLYEFWGASAEEAGAKAIQIVRSNKYHFWSSLVSFGLEKVWEEEDK